MKTNPLLCGNPQGMSCPPSISWDSPFSKPSTEEGREPSLPRETSLWITAFPEHRTRSGNFSRREKAKEQGQGQWGPGRDTAEQHRGFEGFLACHGTVLAPVGMRAGGLQPPCRDGGAGNGTVRRGAGSSRLSLAPSLGAIWACRGPTEEGGPRAEGIPGEPARATGSSQHRHWEHAHPHVSAQSGAESQPGARARGQRCPPLSRGDARGSKGGAGAGKHVQSRPPPHPEAPGWR